MRPILRYHGGKFRLAPWIIERMPAHRVYVEPYGGGAGVLLQKPRAFAEVYNDMDADVVNVFRVLRDPGAAEDLRRRCYFTPWARDEFWTSYEPTDDPVERARRTIFRSFAGFGSSSRRKHRTGFRAKAFRQRHTEQAAWQTWPSWVVTFVERMRGVVIENRPAIEVIHQHDTTVTLFYVDPPYPLESRSSIRGPGEIGRAYAHEMTDQDHRELAGVLHSIEGMALVSGYRCPLNEELYGGWKFDQVGVQADAAAKRTEVVWFNQAAASAATGRLF